MDLTNLKKDALRDQKRNKGLAKRLKKMPGKEVDQLFEEAHEESFEEIDCLSCANCCKTTGPLFTNKDIDRISKSLKLKPTQFIEKYLRIDEDNDYVLKTVPCSFLGPDNYCSIYDVRPKACREYPHTDRSNQKQILNLAVKNLMVCPAVQRVFDKVHDEIGK